MARRREFDEDQLIASATQVFWSRGYTATSLQEIARRSGVGTSSIYAAYGNKWGLFLVVFERYCADRVALVRAAVAVGGSHREVATRFLSAIAEDCAGQPERRGCLMLNSLGELGSEHPEVRTIASRTNAAMELAVRSRLSNGKGGDDIDASSLAASLVAFSQGLIAVSRLGADDERLHRMAALAGSAVAA
ncbi:MAG TPA: TetR/AcrR family transcriptional regulator [Humibacter sp.]|jgi:TetR/AcrR family transcriptional repressor of nem operon|nr:TetR/AcrR family transcriptional regulator [Humibacter sp.]